MKTPSQGSQKPILPSQVSKKKSEKKGFQRKKKLKKMDKFLIKKRKTDEVEVDTKQEEKVTLSPKRSKMEIFDLPQDLFQQFLKIDTSKANTVEAIEKRFFFLFWQFHFLSKELNLDFLKLQIFC